MIKYAEFKDAPTEIPIRIPIESLSPEAILGAIQDFVLREGTDYGTVEATFETKIDQIMRQLHTGEVELFFDANSKTVTLVCSRR